MLILFPEPGGGIDLSAAFVFGAFVFGEDFDLEDLFSTFIVALRRLS